MKAVEYLNKLNEADNVTQENLSEYITVWADIDQLIDQLPDRRHRLILCSRFILGRSWNEISEIVGLSKAQTFNQYNLALQQFCKYSGGRFTLD